MIFAIFPRLSRLLALLALACWPGIVLAQQPSPTALAAAKELIEIKGVNTMFDVIVPGVVEQAKNTFIPTNPGLIKELTEVAAQLRNELAPRRAELINEIAKIYSERFSEQELKDAIAFYKTPLGKKLIAEEPVVGERSLQFAQGWANKLSEEVISRMRAEMKKRGHEI